MEETTEEPIEEITENNSIIVELLDDWDSFGDHSISSF